MDWKRSTYCANGLCVEVAAHWQRSSYCSTGGCVEWSRSRCSMGSCVEVERQDEKVYLRDSKLGEESPVIEFTPACWSEFLDAVRRDALPDDAIEMMDGGVWLPVPGPRFDGWHLKFDREEWDAFVKGVKAGEFDLQSGGVPK